MQKVRTMAAIMILFMGAGCTPMVQSNITTFHELSAEQVRGKTAAVLPANAELEESLEFRAEKPLVERGLAGLGLRVISLEEAKARGVDYAVFFGYGANSGREQLYSYSIPTYGQTGVSSSVTSGTMNSVGPTSNFSATTTYMPQYGITGHQNHIGSTTVYDRTAVIDIWKMQAGSDPIKVYETTVNSSGSSQQVTAVLDEMIAALFKSFWQQGSRTESIAMN